MDQFVGEIRIFAGNYEPNGWAFCDGRLLPIQRYTTLYSILGVNYGGDGKTTFALPDLRGAAAMHQGQGPGLSPRTLGEKVGSKTVTLLSTEMPSHYHQAQNQATANTANPGGAIWSDLSGRNPNLYSPSPNVDMNPIAIGISGRSQPHNNMQPYLGLNFIIALEGDFPPRS